MGGNAGIKNLASVDLQPFMRPGLVDLRQSGIAGDVGCKDGSQSALHLSAFVRRTCHLDDPGH